MYTESGGSAFEKTGISSQEGYPSQFPVREHFPPAAGSNRELPAELSPEQRERAQRLIEETNTWIDMTREALETSNVLYGHRIAEWEQQIHAMGNGAPENLVEHVQWIKRKEKGWSELLKALHDIKDTLTQGRFTLDSVDPIERTLEHKINLLF